MADKTRVSVQGIGVSVDGLQIDESDANSKCFFTLGCETVRQGAEGGLGSYDAVGLSQWDTAADTGL